MKAMHSVHSVDALFERLENTNFGRAAEEDDGKWTSKLLYTYETTTHRSVPSPICLFCTYKLLDPVVPRFPDVIFGFVATCDTEFSVSVGGQHLCTTQLSKGRFAFAVDDAFPLFTPSLAIHEVRVTPHEDLRVVSALLSKAESQRLALGSWCGYPVGPDEKYMVVSSGTLSLLGERPKDAQDLPRLNRVKESKKRTALLFEDLMKRVWHPRRVAATLDSHELLAEQRVDFGPPTAPS